MSRPGTSFGLIIETMGYKLKQCIALQKKENAAFSRQFSPESQAAPDVNSLTYPLPVMVKSTVRHWEMSHGLSVCYIFAHMNAGSMVFEGGET